MARCGVLLKRNPLTFFSSLYFPCILPPRSTNFFKLLPVHPRKKKYLRGQAEERRSATLESREKSEERRRTGGHVPSSRNGAWSLEEGHNGGHSRRSGSDDNAYGRGRRAVALDRKLHSVNQHTQLYGSLLPRSDAYQSQDENEMRGLVRQHVVGRGMTRSGSDEWVQQYGEEEGRSATQPRQRELPIAKTVSKRATKSKGEAVTVGVRIRPIQAEAWEHEMEHGGLLRESFYAELDRTVLEVDLHGHVCNSWSFDYVFGGASTTSEIFDALAMPVVDKAVDGFNSTIFAYGQTASGKTFSMFGNEENPGITTRAVYAVFEKVNESKFSEFFIRGSFIEIHAEELKDLLALPPKLNIPSVSYGESKRTDFFSAAPDLRLKIIEDPQTGPYVKGAVERVVNRPEHILDLIQFGEQNRHYSATNMNERSSRSHVVVRLVIKRGFVSPGQGKVQLQSNESSSPELLWHVNPKIPQRISSLNFVDLAGSEKSKKTGATGSQLREANAINKSLLALGTVINRLVENGGKGGGHIPYRDSKYAGDCYAYCLFACI